MIFELIEIEVQCSKNYLKMFLSQEAGASGNNIEKEPQKPLPILKKYISYIHREYMLCPQSRASGSFCKRVLILQRLKFSHFEGSALTHHSE